ncbi:integral membrane protein [Colletotrichum musicola]|uniref:Integral membrane protein n=1 Tax=Colletotrichum musicola TaxID=2175873 RepID=A0A8H6NCN5_9PEZI|nr:integral membrane protein [Colletotrichum musicola]
MASPISSMKNVVEPAFIVFAFTVGALINRRRCRADCDDDVGSCERGGSEDSLSRPTSPLLKPAARAAGSTPADRVERKLLVRFFRTFPFLAEIWYWNLTYWVYQLLRAFSARMIAGNEAVFDRARAHAISILRLEHLLGLDVELAVQRRILAELPWLMPVLAKVYYSHISLGICFIIYAYSTFPPSTFQRVRRTIAMDNVVAFVIVTSWRCMPPRLLPAEYGFVDVLHSPQGGGNAWTHNKFQLTIAAMPSLHCGTALFLAWCVCRFSPHRPLRMVAPLWPAAMLLTIVATANHFILDAVVGAMVPVIGWRYNHALLRLKPLQNRVLEKLGLRVPDDERSPTPVPKEW